MRKTIKSTEAKYNSFRFKSRLETRWAIFFDMVGLECEYEAERSKVSGIRYLPNFYIPGLDRWFEVKAKPLGEREMKECGEFCLSKDHANIKLSVLVGSSEAVKIDKSAGIMEYVWEWSSEKYPEDVGSLAPRGLSEKKYHSRFIRGLWIVPDVTEEKLTKAVAAARETRFEFGETPSIGGKDERNGR